MVAGSRSRNTVLVLCACLATMWMTHGASVIPASVKHPAKELDSRLHVKREVDNSTDADGATTTSSDSWLGRNWLWLLVLLVAMFVFVLLALICCCYKRSTSLGVTGRMQLSSMKTTLPSQNLIGFASPVSTSVGDRESYHGNLIVSPGILSTEQTPVASPQLQFISSSLQRQRQNSPRNSMASRYSYHRKNQSPANSSGSEETIRHATGTPSISSFASVSSSLNGKMSRAQSFTGVGQQPRLSRWRSGSQVKVISLSREASSLSVTSTASNSSAHSGASNQSVRSHSAGQSDSSRHTYLAVDVQVRVNREMTQKEKNMYTAAVLAESAAKLAQSAASYEEPIVAANKSHKMRTSHSGRRYYSTTAGLRQANESPTRRSSPSHSLPMPVSHSIHFSKPVTLTNGNLLHSREDPVVSLDNCVRDAHSMKPRPASLSSNDTGDELFTPKQKHLFTGTINIIRPPPSSHRSQQNSSSEKDRGRTKKSKTAINNGTEEVKKKKRHMHQSTSMGQDSIELTRFAGGEASEMPPPHMRNPYLPTDRSVDSTAQPTPVEQLPGPPATRPSGDNTKTSSESKKVSNPSVDGGTDEEIEDGLTKEEEETERKKPLPSLGSSGQLKRMSVSVSLSSSLSSGINELNQAQGFSNLKRQRSVPNLQQSTSFSHANHISRPPSGTSVSASGYGASMDSASSVDSITTLTKPSGQNTTLSYPLRKLLEGEHDRCGATDLQFSVHDHNTSGTSSAASSGMAEKAPLSPALPLISTNGFSASSSNSNHANNMYGCRPSITGMASAEV